VSRRAANVAPGVAALPCAILQPLSLLDRLKFTWDKAPASIGASHGEVIIEKK
jgi:hypothetical protein